MFPIRDDNPTQSRAYVTIGLIVLNCLIFLFAWSRPGDGMQQITWKYGYVPAELVQSSVEFGRGLRRHPPVRLARDPLGRPLADFWGRPLVQRDGAAIRAAEAVPASINIFTCMFLHGGWWHLLGNMLYLWIFGNNIEDKLGPVLFGVFYLGTGLVGNVAHTVFEASYVPLVGASGAISGVMGAYILLFPRARILAIVPVGWYPLTVTVPAWMFLGFYFLIQNVYSSYFTGGQDNVAYWAHIGGFLSGLALIFVFPRRKGPEPSHVNKPTRGLDEDADVVI